MPASQPLAPPPPASLFADDEERSTIAEFIGMDNFNLIDDIVGDDWGMDLNKPKPAEPLPVAESAEPQQVEEAAEQHKKSHRRFK